MTDSFKQEHVRYVMGLLDTREERGLHFPNPANIAREVKREFDDEIVNWDSYTRQIVSELENDGKVEDLEVAGNDKPYQLTSQGEQYFDTL